MDGSNQGEVSAGELLEAVGLPICHVRISEDDVHVVRGNRRFEEAAGVSPGQASGRSLVGLLGPAGERLAACVRDALSGSHASEEELVLRGQARWISTVAQPLSRPGDVVLTLVDRTEEHRRADELRLRAAEFEALVENSPDVIARFDRQLRHIYVNRAVEEASGMPREAFLEKDHVELGMPHDLIDSWQRTYRYVFETGKEGRKEFEFEGRQGVRSFVSRVVPELDSDGEVISILSVARDVTDQKRAAAERLELERRLQHASKLESLGVLAGGIAHDFNNLLVGVLGNASLLREVEPLSPRARTLVERVEAAGQRAADLCRQLLAYAGKASLRVGPQALDALTRETIRLVAQNLPVGVELIPELTPARVEADPTQVRQLVINLVLNAAEASERGGAIHVRVGRAAPELATAAGAVVPAPDPLPDAGFALLEVEDHGSGMPPETLSRVFDPFFTTKFQGRGLGLAAALGVVRAHRGVLRVRSAVGQGTTFTILLPLASAAAEGAADPGSPDRERLTGRLLIVDDDPRVAATAQGMAEQIGLSAAVASSGEAALELFDAGAAFDVVLLDLTMPGLSGLETLDRLRERGRREPVVLTSGYSSDGGVAWREHGAQGFLEKPYGVALLERSLRSALTAKSEGD